MTNQRARLMIQNLAVTQRGMNEYLDKLDARCGKKNIPQSVGEYMTLVIQDYDSSLKSIHAGTPLKELNGIAWKGQIITAMLIDGYTPTALYEGDCWLRSNDEITKQELDAIMATVIDDRPEDDPNFCIKKGTRVALKYVSSGFDGCIEMWIEGDNWATIFGVDLRWFDKE